MSSKEVLLMTLAGVEDAHLDDGFIVGHWKRELAYITNRPRKQGALSVLEDFVNVRSEEPREILRFTLKYGPLSERSEGSELEFRQSIKDWKDYQGFVRRLWSYGPNLGSGLGMRIGEMVYFDRKGRVAKIVVHSIKRFVDLELCSRPYVLRRVCARPSCGTYFIAARKDSRLCGTPLCADIVRKQQMLNWWREHGDEWRERRRQKTQKSKGGKRSTAPKTRD